MTPSRINSQRPLPHDKPTPLLPFLLWTPLALFLLDFLVKINTPKQPYSVSLQKGKSMEDYRSKPYVDNRMQIDSYYGTSKPTSSNFHDMRSYSVPYAPTYMGNNKDLKLKKGKSTSRTSSKSWTLSDPEFQRKKRVASYKAYSVEGKMKGSFRKSFRWLKARYHQIVYGWS